jgi:hypothetical protein
VRGDSGQHDDGYVRRQYLLCALYQNRSAPLVLRISALQLLFEFRIRFTPENCEILGNLHREVTWRPERVFDAVQILDACCNGGCPVDGVEELHGATLWQLNPLGRSQISQYESLALRLDLYCRIAVTGKVPNSESLQVNSMRSPSVDTVPEQSPADVSPDW